MWVLNWVTAAAVSIIAHHLGKGFILEPRFLYFAVLELASTLGVLGAMVISQRVFPKDYVKAVFAFGLGMNVWYAGAVIQCSLTGTPVDQAFIYMSTVIAVLNPLMVVFHLSQNNEDVLQLGHSVDAVDSKCDREASRS